MYRETTSRPSRRASGASEGEHQQDDILEQVLPLHGRQGGLGSRPGSAPTAATHSRADGDKRIAISKPWPQFAAWQVRQECLGCYFAPAPACSLTGGKGEGNMISARFPYKKQ